MRYIGDVHGEFAEYERIATEVPASIQVGDFGLGFGYEESILPATHRFIRGNHDSPGACSKHRGWIPDDTIEGDTYFIGGAKSIDRHSRVEGQSWWRDEELSQDRMWDIAGKFFDGKLKPRVIVSHDCPRSVSLRLFPNLWLKNESPSRTSQLLDGLFASWQPELHIFGHWHEWKDEVINGTRFICLPELGYIDVDPKTLEVSYS